MNNQSSTYDENSEQAIIGNEFSHRTLSEIQEYCTTAYHAEGVVPEYDIIIPESKYGFPKIECKVCGVITASDNRKYVKIPESLFVNSEARFVRIRFLNKMNIYSECYYRLVSLKKYYDKMKHKVKIIENGSRRVILWPLHLLEGMYTRLENTKALFEFLDQTIVTDLSQSDNV